MRIDPKIRKKTDDEVMKDISKKVAIGMAAFSTYYWFIKLVFLA